MRVLIADDEAIIRMGLKSMLRELGHVVYEANNGREALRVARKQNPDLAIFDVKMPYTDGIQAAKALYQASPLPIILLTAYSDSDLIEEASELPIHGYLIKPIQQNMLKAALAVAVKRFQDVKELSATNEKLALTLETRKLVDRAKGKLMVDKGLNEDDAYRLLQLRARETRLSMREVAQAVLKG